MRIFFELLTIEGISVDSNVPDEPVNDEIYIGAKNRVENLQKYAKENGIEADFYIAIESGITNALGKWQIINVAIVKDRNGYESMGSSPGFPVPEKYVNEIITTDLGKLMDKIFNQSDLRSQKGGINFLTRGMITRIDMTRDAFIMALTQFINGNVWKD